MTRALVLVRAQPQYRREAFEAGARAAGISWSETGPRSTLA